jgi:phage terminase Nu1 subunit (DNA packaging protein)
MAQQPLSLRAYAAHRKTQGLPGGSLQAVQRAVQARRVTVAMVDGVKRIPDPEAADREWAENTDRSRAPGWVKDWADDVEGGQDDDGQDDDGKASSLSTASAREKHWKAELAELNYKQRAGELVNAADVAAEYADFCSTVRTKVLGVPSRMKQAHADLTLAHLATLDELLREALAELAREDAEAA